MKLAIAYSTKDQVKLTKQTFEWLCESAPISHIIWCDGSTDDNALSYFENQKAAANYAQGLVRGGADAAIAWKLTSLLQTDADYLGLMENDVLLDEDWLEPTMDLFVKGQRDGLAVGAVSPRSFVDRVLIQRDGYAVMHNLGAGIAIFTRAAAEIVLQSFRTHWWQDNVRLFAQISGVDLRTYAFAKGNEQWVTTDWGFEAQLVRHGLASLALTPAKVQMIGQNPPLAQQGLTLTSETPEQRGIDQKAFDFYRNSLEEIREGYYKFERPGVIHRDGAGMLFFPHQLGALAGFKKWQGTLELQWSQGFGPFAYRAGKGGASLSVRVSGICSFLVAGGAAGSRVTIQDTRSGFRFAPDLPAGHEYMSLTVPGTPVPRVITMELAEGAVFYGLSCNDPQMLNSTFRFDWAQLPEAV